MSQKLKANILVLTQFCCLFSLNMHASADFAYSNIILIQFIGIAISHD